MAGALALALVPAVGAAQSRPLVVEEAATAPGRTVSFEAGGEYIRGATNGLTGLPRQRADGPLLRLVFSPADSVEIDVEWTTRVAQFQDPVFGDDSDWGDVALRAKVRLLEEREDRPGLAARFGVTLPETTFGNGLGPDALRTFVQVLASRSAGRARWHGNLGLAIHDQATEPHVQSDFLMYGAGVLVEAADAVRVGAEVFGLAGESSPLAESRSEARLVGQWGAGRVRFDAGLRRGLTRSAGRWGLTVGLRWRVR